MEFFTVKNWESFQHYAKRNPPWIKLHRAILDDYVFCSLPDLSKGHLMMLWLYASQNNGQIPHDPKFLEKKLSCENIDFELLISTGFLIRKNGASK
jgi:hypothetical protein